MFKRRGFLLSAAALLSSFMVPVPTKAESLVQYNGDPGSKFEQSEEFAWSVCRGCGNGQLISVYRMWRCEKCSSGNLPGQINKGRCIGVKEYAEKYESGYREEFDDSRLPFRGLKRQYLPDGRWNYIDKDGRKVYLSVDGNHTLEMHA